MLTSKNKLTAKQKIERANISLLGNQHTIAYSGVMMVGTYHIDQDFPTAYTDGVNVVYGEKFIDSLTEPQIRAVILHETLHKVFQHIFLWGHLWEQNPMVANMAVDFIVNLVIEDIRRESNGFVEFWQQPAPLLNEKYRGWDSQMVFKDLMKKGGKGKGGQGNTGEQGGMDSHGWEDAKKMTAQEVQKFAQEIDQAIRQGQLLSKKVTGKESLVLGELTVPEENWREQMTEFMTSFRDQGDISTWRKVNRRWLQHDMYMPTTIQESMGSLLLGIDTSGSIGQEELTKFLSHVQLICTTLKPERVDLLYWDTSVVMHETYFGDDVEELVQSTSPAGGSGTDVTVVPAYIEENKLKVDMAIILTDGFLGGDWGVWKQPVLWGIVGNESAMPSCGKVVRIK